MPALATLNNKQLTLNLFKVSCLLFLAITLSGCTLIGTNKPAALQVSSVPEASVFLDGVHLGKTPYYSDQLKSGSHTVKITASQASYIQKIDLGAETLTVVNRELNDNFMAQSGETLWLEKGQNGVFITSNPQAAEVVVDGKLKGKTPLLIEDLAFGEHKVAVSQAGFNQREFSIKTSAKYRLMADVTLASQLAKDIKIASDETQKSQKLEVLKTPQGYLKVRKEPSLDAEEVGRVSTGDQFEIIQQTQDWIKISFEGKLGWISAAYTKKL